MAKIQEVKNKKYNGFEKCFDKGIISELMQEGQATTIRCGNELEHIILNKCKKGFIIQDFQQFVSNLNNLPNGTYICPKNTKHLNKYLNNHKQPDYIVFIKNSDKTICYITELKDGFTFDTKKVPGEILTLKDCCECLKETLPKNIEIFYRICSFTASTKEDIVSGCKNLINIDNVITGADFCKELGISYNSILKIRKQDIAYNKNYVFNKFFKSNDTINYLAQHPETILYLIQKTKIKNTFNNPPLN